MDGWTDDEQTPGSSLYPPNLSVGDKKSLKLFAIVKNGRKHEGSKWVVTEVVPLCKMEEKHKEANRKPHNCFLYKNEETNVKCSHTS